MNIIFFGIVVIAYLTAAWFQVTGEFAADAVLPMQAVGTAMIDAAGSSVTLAIGLVGVMTLFLGLMQVAEAGGLLTIIAKLLRPILVRLFPEVPAQHPAMGSMVMNLSANALGLANAATPFGIRAITELNKLNSQPGTATNAMILFLAINTSSITLLPTGIIALRAAAGSTDAAGIVPTTLFATIFSTIIAITVAKTMQRFSKDPGKAQSVNGEITADAEEAYPLWVSIAAIITLLALVPLSIVYGRTISPWIIPSLMLGLLGFGFARKVKVYEAFVSGAKEGFDVALRIIPYLVAILVAVAMFRASGALGILIGILSPITTPLGLPAEALPVALMRPLSGSGAYGLVASTINDPAIGPDSYVGYLVSTFQGSTETTFYVLAVYFGAVQVRKIRHMLFAALAADVAGIAAAVFIVNKLWG